MSGGMSGTWGVGGVRCKRKRSNREGEAFVYFDTGKRPGVRTWVVVLWDGEERPECVSAVELMFKHLGERTFKGETFG